MVHFTDLGCGSGKLLLQTGWLAPWIRELQGVEILPELCDLAHDALALAQADSQNSSNSTNDAAAASQQQQQDAAAAAAEEDAQFRQALEEFAQRHALELPLEHPEASASGSASAPASAFASPLAHRDRTCPSMSTRVRVQAADFVASAASWLPHTDLLYVCATAFSESLRRSLFGIIVQGLSVPATATATATATTTPAAAGSAAAAAAAVSSAVRPRSTRLQLPLHALVVLVSYPLPADLNYSGSFRLLHHLRDVRMSWGRCSVYVYRKVHARTAENNILRSFRKT